MANKMDFTSHNKVSLCGRIVRSFKAKRNEYRFEISIGRSAAPVIDEKTGKKRYPLRRNEKGQVIGEKIIVRFFDKRGEEYFAKYKPGDFVVADAVVQTVRNHYDGSTKTDIWGLSFSPKVINGRLTNDHNRVDLRGKVVSSNVVNDNLVIVNILTKCTKKSIFSGENMDPTIIETTYKSITPVGIYYRDGSARAADKEFTKGTWLNVHGYLTTVRQDNADGSFRRKILVRGTKIDVIGVVQPAEDELYQDYLKEKI